MDLGFSGIDFLFDGDFEDLVNLFVVAAIFFGGVVALVYVFVGGMRFITSGGDEEKTKSALKTLRYSVIGLVVIIFSVTIISVIGMVFDFRLTQLIHWDEMRDMFQTFVENLED
jgi:cytochrome bd-type quinol oxidase subunit 2